MPLQYVANENCEITATPAGAWQPGDPNAESDVVQVRTPATKVSAGNAKILCGQISWTVAPGACVFAGHTHVSGSSNVPPPFPFMPPLGFPITSTATKTDAMCDGSLLSALREGDTGTCSGSFTNNTSGATVPCSCQYEITNAGQSKVKAQ